MEDILTTRLQEQINIDKVRNLQHLLLIRSTIIKGRMLMLTMDCTVGLSNTHQYLITITTVKVIADISIEGASQFKGRVK